MQIAIVGLLILLNGVLSMSEFAVVSSTRSRLERLADEGSGGAASAINLVDDPNRFLSTVQVGITLVGILAGTFGGAAIAGDLAGVLRRFPVIGERAFPVALVIVVGITTYLTLVLGELVPKRLAIRHPERIAAMVSRPMKVLSIITLPLVAFLSASTGAVLKLLGQGGKANQSVSEEEVTLLLRQGEEAGVFRRAETRMVAGVFRLDDIRADALMTPRVDVAWLDLDADAQDVRRVIAETGHTRYPVCDGMVDRVVGTVSATQITLALLDGAPLDLRALAQEPHFVPETADAGTLVQRVAGTGAGFFVVLGEHGGVDGVLTVHDLAEAVLGDLGRPEARSLGEGRWRIAGVMPIEEVEAVLDACGMRQESAKSYGTLAGFILDRLGRVPREGDSVSWNGLRFIVTSITGHRIRQVTVERLAEPPQR